MNNWGVKSTFSFILYNSTFLLISKEKVWISVANPDKPIKMLSCILKIFCWFEPTVKYWIPILWSEPIATHLSPIIPTSELPLYVSIDYIFENIMRNDFTYHLFYFNIY